MDSHDFDHPEIPKQATEAPVSGNRPSCRPWDRLPGEPAQWFAGFQVYLSLGRDRTILDAECLSQKKPKKARKCPSGSWNVAAKTWKWMQRASEWDAWQAEAATKTVEACNERLRHASASAFANVAELVDRLAASPNIVAPEHRNDLLKCSLLVGKGGAMMALSAANRSQFGDRSKVEVTHTEKEVDWSKPFS